MSIADTRFPTRPVTIRRDSVSRPHGYVFLTFFMLAMAAFIAYWQGPDLLKDIEISKHPLVLDDGNIQNGKCTTRKGILTDCEARLVYSRDGRNYQKDVHLFFVDFHVGDYESDLVISAEHPELATLTIGLDKLWNRIISFAVLFLLVAGAGVGLLWLGLRVGRVERQLRHPAVLAPVPVEITAFNRNRRGLFITYADKLSSHKTNRSAYTHFPSGEEPLIVGTARDGKAVGLAVRHGRTALPILLDSRLARLDISDEERRAALAPIEAEFAAAGGMIVLQEPKKKRRILRGVLTFVILMLLLIAGVLGYWLWYVTSAPSQFNQVGMEINNILPGPMNTWGCGQLQQRFGNDRAPFGCVAGDFRSWK